MSGGPLCFVLMPFGKKSDAAGAQIDFDAVYRDVIAPAVRAAGMEPLRADEEVTGGIIHKPMFERLILCEYAVADLTTANANVFYELGVRHAVRPWATVSLFAGTSRLPFDVAMLRALPYAIGADGLPAEAEAARDALAERLRAALTEPAADSPIYQLVENFPDVDHTKTDVFRDRVNIAAGIKERLATARQSKSADGVRVVEESLGELVDDDAGVLVDLLLSYRAVSAWESMIALVARLPRPLAETVMVQEQYAFALNRAGRREDAERVLQGVLKKHGPSSETYGLLGRVYKDQWEAALKAGQAFAARGHLKRAVDAYLRGFEADWRDAYPGVNAVTLMEISEPPDPRREELVPVVRYAVRRRVAGGTPDYWDHATLLELAVLGCDEEGAAAALGDALAAVREPWEPETTARNLRLIREARDRRGDGLPWAAEVEQELDKAASR
jgi:tetratricopeptide (TPR) repeat protein